MPGTQQQYTVTLKQMVGRLMTIKPNLPPTLAADFINDAIRVISDRKPRWTGYLDFTTFQVPAPDTTGTVSVSQNSTSVTGSGTSWPVDDIVNTTIPAGISRLGLQEVTPASMDGIDVDTILYVDSAGTPEVVYVKSVSDFSFMADFRSFHNPNCTATASSYANRQIRMGGMTYPIFTIKAVLTATSLLISTKWTGTALSGAALQIVKRFYTFDAGLKSILSVTDPTQGIPPLNYRRPADYLDVIDPQRTATGYPQNFAPRGPDLNGNMQYELWPTPTSARQLNIRYYRQPPPLVTDSDFLPPMLNPTVVFSYAASMALGTKIGEIDPYFDIQRATLYMKQFEDQYNAQCVADDDKNLTDGSWDVLRGGYPGGADWQRNHAVSVFDDGWW